MLAYLTGTITNKEMTGGPNDRVVLDVHGMGFEVTVSRRTLLEIGKPGDEVTISTALSIRETEWTIFGFASPDERELFALLQTVTGVGPKLALALVGALGHEHLAAAIIKEDHRLICQAPGVGSKVSQRIVLELKTKVEDWSRAKGMVQTAPHKSINQALDEVRAILEGLGYTPSEINAVLKRATQESDEEDVEELVRFSLKILGKASFS